jgi:flagellin-like hook-associated protein FlgL
MSLRIGEFVNPAVSVLSLNKATAQTQKALSRLSSGARIVETSDDAAGAAVASKLEAAINRCGATATNLQNADSFLRTQASALDALGKGVTRLMELKTLSLDSTKNATDIANYSTEFSELRRSLVDISNMKFNGIDLFSHTGVDTYLNIHSDENGQQQVRLTQYALGVNATDWLSEHSSFSFVPGTLDWKESEADALKRGGYLATIDSPEKWNTIVAAVGADLKKTMWIGGHQLPGSKEPDGGWVWRTGEPVIYSNWASSEPNNAGGNESGIQINYPGHPFGSWNDIIDSKFNTQNAGYLLETPSKSTCAPFRRVH